MDDLISRKALIADLRTAKGLGSIIAETIVRFVEKQPTVDAAEVVHGRWVKVNDGVLISSGHHWECSVCHKWVPWEHTGWHYCPNCGADMRERKDNG